MLLSHFNVEPLKETLQGLHPQDKFQRKDFAKEPLRFLKTLPLYCNAKVVLSKGRLESLERANLVLSRTGRLS